MSMLGLDWFGGGKPDFFHKAAAGTTSTSGGETSAFTMTIPAAEVEAGADYLVIWSCEIGCNTVGNATRAHLYINGVQRMEVPMDTRDLTPQCWRSAGGFRGAYDFSALFPGVDVVVELRVSRVTAVGTHHMRNKKITVLKLGPDDHAVTFGNAVTTTSAAYVTAQSTTFTPPSAGDYLILCSFKHWSSSSGVRMNYRVDNNIFTTVGGNHSENGGQGNAIFGFKQTGISGLRTLKVEHLSNNAGVNSNVDEVCFAALRLDRFANNYSTQISADNGGTEGSYTTAVTQTFTPAVGKHLALACYRDEGSSTSVSIYQRFLDDGVVMSDCMREPRNTFDDDMGGIAQNLAAYAASSRTQIIQRAAEAGGATADIRARSAIHTLSLIGLVEGTAT